MRLFKQLERWKIRRQINQSIIDVVFRLRDRLAHYWQADVNTPQMDFMLQLKFYQSRTIQEEMTMTKLFLSIKYKQMVLQTFLPQMILISSNYREITDNQSS